jgi:hypothetical protein
MQKTALVFADYVADYLSSFHAMAYVATRYEPTSGRLNPNRTREEPHFQMIWEPVRPLGRRSVYELNIGAHELSFIASMLPGDKRDANNLYEQLFQHKDQLVDLGWEHCLRFVAGTDFEAWQNWAVSWNALVPLIPGQMPGRFSVCIEAGPIPLPVEASSVTFHLSNALRRTNSVLTLL